MTLMKRGFFITAEGMDGSGKTTQIKNMQEYLSAMGCEILLTREPGGTRISESIRSVILNPEYTEMTDTTELMLYSAARAQLVEQQIKPSMEKGVTVICDRYVDSFYAYQGFGRGLDIGRLKKITDMAVSGLMPDITFFFDLDPETALKRRFAATQSDRIENEMLDFHKRVYKGYKEIAASDPQRIKVIDASKSPEEVWQNVRRQLDMALGFIKLV